MKNKTTEIIAIIDEIIKGLSDGTLDINENNPREVVIDEKFSVGGGDTGNPEEPGELCFYIIKKYDKPVIFKSSENPELRYKMEEFDRSMKAAEERSKSHIKTKILNLLNQITEE